MSANHDTTASRTPLTGFLSWLQDHCPAGVPRWGWVAVQLGLFFLARSARLGGILLVAGLVVATWRKGFAAYWSDGLNRVLLVVAGLLLAGASQAVSGDLAWWGLFNWLPLFWGFWGWQAYLGTPEARRRCSGWLVAGTVPVLVSGLGQMVLGWQGAWSVGDLTIWSVDPGGNPEGRLSGFFGHANFAAAWLALTWPLTLTHLLKPCLHWRQRGAVLALAVLHSLCLWLTASRSGWGAMILAFPLILGPWSWAWFLPLLLLAAIPFTLAILSSDPLGLQDLAQSVVPDPLWQRFAAESFQNRAVGDTRLEMWTVARQLVLERPWLGWGAAAFGMLYSLRSGFSAYHPHNLPLDLGLSFGVPVALLLLAVPTWVVTKAMRRGMATSAIADRGWLAAFLLLASIHAMDSTYYDSRINMAGWFLLAGLRAYGLAAASQRRLTGATSGGAQME